MNKNMTFYCSKFGKYIRYPYEMRKLIYTTNITESVNSVLRKVTMGKKVFPSEESLSKTAYLVIKGLEEK